MSFHTAEDGKKKSGDLIVREKGCDCISNPSFRVSDDDVSSLLLNMVSLGYFHKKYDADALSPKNRIVAKDGLEGGSEIDSFRIDQAKEFKNRLQDHPYNSSDDACSLLFSSSSSSTSTSSHPFYCMTRRHLSLKIEQLLLASNGRISLETISHDIGISIADVKRSAQDLMEISTDEQSQRVYIDTKIQLVQNELLTSGYLDDICCNQVNASLESNDGCVLISDLARDVFDLPFEYTLATILDRIDCTKYNSEDNMDKRIILEGAKLVMGRCGGKRLVTADYQNKRQKEIFDVLSLVTTPMLINDLVAKIEWDPSLIVNHVKTLCDSKQLEGELHVDFSAFYPHKTALYKPRAYSDKQDEALEEFFALNGYITLGQCSMYSMSESKMVEYILRSFPCTLRLSKSIVQPDIIVPPIQAAIEECIAVKSFLDLSMYLPEGLMTNNSGDDLRQLLDIVLEEVEKSSCCTDTASVISARDCLLLSCGEVLYFSHSMIQQIQTTILPTVADNYARDHAKQAIELSTTTSREKVNGDDYFVEERKFTKKEKKRRKKKKLIHTDDEDEWLSMRMSNLVPLYIVAKKIAENYPNLKDIQEAHCAIAENDVDVGPFQWMISDQDGDERKDGGPLYEFCRSALHTSKFEEICSIAIKAELLKMKKGIMGSSIESRSIESSFEDKSCFTTACHLVQILSKLPKSLVDDSMVNDDTVSMLERDFLCGCGSDFAKRITQYCLFKHQVEDGIFNFDVDTNNIKPDERDQFYTPTNIARRSFQKVYLTCTPDNNNNFRDPLPLLRNFLPSNIGVLLARLWILTGGENYEGGTKKSESGTELIRPGNFIAFLGHIEESCLAICGIPFKILDKKSEKSLMFARRKEITGLLERASNLQDVLEYTVILLFHQIKGTAVCGTTLSCTILSVLVADKRIPGAVTKKLLEAASALQEETVSDELLNLIRSFGLSKDITKLDI